MAKQRKRFYVGIPNGYADRTLFSLGFTPSADLFDFRFRQVLGPFRTRAGADLARRSPILTRDWSVRKVETFAAKVAQRFSRKVA